MDTLTLPTAFEQEQIAAYFDGVAARARRDGDDMAEWTARQHAANARLAADYLRRPCHECAR